MRRVQIPLPAPIFGRRQIHCWCTRACTRLFVFQELLKSMSCARHETGIVPGLTGAANLGPDAVNCAAGRDADLAGQGAAPVAQTPHAAQVQRHEPGWNAIEIGIVFGGEARPMSRESAAGTAGLAVKSTGNFGRPHDRSYRRPSALR